MQHRRHPVHLAKAVLTALALGLACTWAAAQPWVGDGWRLAGEGRLRYWGLSVYDAKLWVDPGFSASAFERHGFALELAYLRDLRGQDIADLSITEMQRLTPMDPSESRRRQAHLRALFPDVREGDRIAGVYRPGRGAEFLHNGRRLGEIADAPFAAQFFAIWLAPGTTLSGLRAALLQKAEP